MNWSKLYRLRLLPVRKAIMPATLLVPAIAIAYGFLQKMQANDKLATKLPEEIFEVIRYEYSPVMFFYFIAGLLFTAFVCLAEVSCPEVIKRNGDFESFVARVREANRTLTEQGARTSIDVKYLEASWTQSEKKAPFVRAMALLAFAVSMLLVGFGFFVYVPARVFQFDSFGRLVARFFLLQ